MIAVDLATGGSMMKDVYNFDNFYSSKVAKHFHYLVAGHPISHSLSPLMHNIALLHHAIDAAYVAVDLEAQFLSGFTAWMNNDSFLGCNITIPYKQQLLTLPDHLSEEAETLGAINTIAKINAGTELKGYNTDIYGFQQPLLRFKNMLDYDRAIVFGTGGASLAVQYALWDLGFEEIILVSRSPDRATPLKNHRNVRLVDYTQWQEFAIESSLIVNTTPLGMGELKDESVVQPPDSELLENKLCYDLVYNPLNTRFLQLAAAAGATTINGLDMLIHQGSRSFEIWTGYSFPIEIVRRELLTFFND